MTIAATTTCENTSTAAVKSTAMAVRSRLPRPLSAIATRVGYISQFAFANAFKRVFDRSPGRYRETARLAPPEEAFGPASAGH